MSTPQLQPVDLIPVDRSQRDSIRTGASLHQGHQRRTEKVKSQKALANADGAGVIRADPHIEVGKRVPVTRGWRPTGDPGCPRSTNGGCGTPRGLAIKRCPPGKPVFEHLP